MHESAPNAPIAPLDVDLAGPVAAPNPSAAASIALDLVNLAEPSADLLALLGSRLRLAGCSHDPAALLASYAAIPVGPHGIVAHEPILARSERDRETGAVYSVLDPRGSHEVGRMHVQTMRPERTDLTRLADDLAAHARLLDQRAAIEGRLALDLERQRCEAIERARESKRLAEERAEQRAADLAARIERQRNDAAERQRVRTAPDAAAEQRRARAQREIDARAELRRPRSPGRGRHALAAAARSTSAAITGADPCMLALMTGAIALALGVTIGAVLGLGVFG